ncbi:SDR family oxidoreductase [uncultured Litoreibacter sp.]|uniref:SDR family NAD(P)-dependent oxidoreductase n=1 Tax=uncultured Litoreibacter sp. TaxID=1392394 RepID=UPI0026252103|nr:SDR family oxidoreductase [uncultured Litoreibacter sp.]
MSKDTSKTALVTGASRGLGAACAEWLAANGFHVIALARTTGALEELDDRIQSAGGSATLVPVDLTNDDAMRQICRSIFDRWGKLDMLVHAAIHAAPLCPTAHMDEKDMDKSIASNIRATSRLIVNTEPLLKAGKGQAVFFNDAVQSNRFHATYGMTKAAQMRIARSWQDEAAASGITVHIKDPKPMPTATRARFYPGEDRDALTPCKDEADRLLADLI